MNSKATRIRRFGLVGKTMILLAVGAMAFGTWVAAASADELSADFTICGEGRRVNCVVDGDTFWFQRQKIRMADVDAPELSPPRCEAERRSGMAAKQMLFSLLNAGPFTLAPADRDADRYGRKLRIVLRNGQSIGEMLVAAKLARPWTGARRGWCD